MSKNTSGLKHNHSLSKEDDASTSCSAILFGERRFSQLLRKLNEDDHDQEESSEDDDEQPEVKGYQLGDLDNRDSDLKAKQVVQTDRDGQDSNLLESQVVNVVNTKDLQESIVIQKTFKPKLYRNRPRNHSGNHHF